MAKRTAYLKKLHPGVVVACLFFLITAFAVFADDVSNSEELYKSIFGDDYTLAEQEAAVAVFVNGNYQGDVSALLGLDVAKFDRVALLAMLGEIIADGFLKAIDQDTKNRDYLEVSQFSAYGIEARFDASRFQLYLEVPLKRLKPEYVRLTDSIWDPHRHYEGPAAISGYLNLRSGISMDYQEYENGSRTTYPYQIDMEPVLNLGSWVLEGQLGIDSLLDPPFTVDYYRVVKDLPALAMRMEAGTLLMPVTGFQSTLPLTGVEIVSLANLPFTRKKLFTDNREFILEHPAKVDIYLNNRLVKSFYLKAGRHRIVDFPFISGLNSLKIIVREAGRKPQVYYEQVAFDSRLLPRGEASYALSAGIMEYNWEYPLLSGFFHLGLLDVLTAGIYVQTALDRQLEGVDLILASPVGSFKSDLGISHGTDTDVDFAASLQYRFAIPSISFLPVFAIGAQYTGEKFAGPGFMQKENRYIWEFSAIYSQSLPGGVGMSISSGYRLGRGFNPHVNTVSLTLIKPLGKNTTLSMNASAEVAENESADFHATLSLTSSPADSPGSVAVSHDLTEGNSSLDFQVRPSQRHGAPGFYATLFDLPFRAEDGFGGGLGAWYRGNRFETAFSDSFHTGTEQSPLGMNKATLQFSSALAFAGLDFAVTRPITDSFALVVPEENMEDYPIGVNPHGNGYEAWADKGESAVLPELKGYQPYRVILEAPESPPGYDLGEQTRYFIPGYRSGVLLKIGTEAVVYAGGRLLFLNHTPVRYQAGRVLGINGLQSEPQLFYTDAEGKFEVYGLKSGKYELELLVNEMARTEFEVPEDTRGYLDLGTLLLPVLEKE